MRSNFGCLASRPHGRRVSPGSSSASPRAFCSDEHDLEERRVAEVALGLQLLDELLEGQVLVGVGAETVASRTRASSVAEAGLARDRSAARRTRVLTKKPISPSISRAGAVGDGEPTTTSSCAGVAGQQRLRRRRAAAMNRVAPSRRPSA